MAERLLRHDEYRAAGPFIQSLRARTDPAPARIKPPIPFHGAVARHCIVNAVDYCDENPEWEPVLGFKLWVFRGVASSYIGLVHAVARHREQQPAQYVDVTPADAGDEGQPMIFVPSSRLYAGWTVGEIAALAKAGMQPRMGSVCTGLARIVKVQTEGEALHKSNPEELKLLLCPSLDAAARHCFNSLRNTDILADEAGDLWMRMLDRMTEDGARIVEDNNTKFVIVEADVWRAAFAEVTRGLASRPIDLSQQD